MRDYNTMAMIIRDRERPNPRVWQPWYMEEGEGGGGKELPSREKREKRARERVRVDKHSHLQHLNSHSPLCSDEEDEINVVDSPSPTGLRTELTTGLTTFYYPEEEGPIDMTTKSRRMSPVPRPNAYTQNSPSPPPYHPRPDYMPRPSVICVPPAHRERPYVARPPPPPPYSVAVAGSANTRRQVVQAGPVDPEIDEHFRRSLGQDYHHIFTTTPPQPQPSTDSVDDHFAKALGETWRKIQAERQDSSTSSTSSSGGGREEGGGGGGGGGRKNLSPICLIST